jgi:hypothetical protein
LGEILLRPLMQMKRPGNNPKRRIAAADLLSQAERAQLAETVEYVGSGHHKRRPADYGLDRTSPRPTKSLCDLIRIVTRDEAKAMLRTGILCGMFSDFFFEKHPKYVWCVDADGEVYEAKTDSRAPGPYHGYRLEEEDEMRDQVKGVWRERCQQTGP